MQTVPYCTAKEQYLMIYNATARSPVAKRAMHVRQALTTTYTRIIDVVFPQPNNLVTSVAQSSRLAIPNRNVRHLLVFHVDMLLLVQK